MLPRRFCGPPESANGGYTAGVLAQHLGVTAEVTLRRPPPLERPLRIEHEDGRVVFDGADLVAEASATTVDLELPPPVTVDAAAAASRGSPFRDATIHPFPTCFTCGPSRDAGDGLRLFAGRVPAPTPSPCHGRPMRSATRSSGPRSIVRAAPSSILKTAIRQLTSLDESRRASISKQLLVRRMSS
jgi:hypothetical protein